MCQEQFSYLYLENYKVSQKKVIYVMSKYNKLGLSCTKVANPQILASLLMMLRP